jgi:cytoskeleton protein RodZ
MSDTPDTSDVSSEAGALTAGAMLRRARQAQGLHIAALAAAIKVTPRKLELLESDQYDKLTDATFVRALAQAVCRTLKIDASPVLALMPPPSGNRLDQVDHGLNAPFRERPGRLVPTDWSSLTSPAVWLAGLLVLAAITVYLMPTAWLATSKPAPHPASIADVPRPAAVDAAASVASTEPGAAPASAAASAPATVATRAADGSASAASGDPAFPPAAAEGADDSTPAGSELLQLHASAQSWVEVSDARGQSLIARMIEAGETVDLDGALPLKLKIGNARATEVVFRGRPIELAASTRDNVARLELK